MGKEHGGGAIPDGLFRVPVEWSEDRAQPVPIVHFDASCLDSLSDLCREALAANKPIEPILRNFIAVEKRNWMSDGASAVLAEIITSPDPKRTACAWSYATGLHATEGKSGPELARQFGVRKQAFFQEVERILRRLGGRLIRLNMRDPKARAKMAVRNFRRA
jgi:hypothetical protein